MKGLFNYDGPLFTFLGKMTDILILNVLMVIFCIPIITIGPTLAAGHYAALKIHRGESYVVRNFWKSFKENFVQGIGIGLIFTVILSVSVLGILIMNSAEGTFARVVQGVILATIIFVVFTLMWVFPLQSKFVNKVGNTIKNAFLLSFKYLLRTIYMITVYLLPPLLLFISLRTLSVVLLFGLGLPVFLSAVCYNKVFEQLEDAVLGRNTEETEDTEETEEETPCLE